MLAFLSLLAISSVVATPTETSKVRQVAKRSTPPSTIAWRDLIIGEPKAASLKKLAPYKVTFGQRKVFFGEKSRATGGELYVWQPTGDQSASFLVSPLFINGKLAKIQIRDMLPFGRTFAPHTSWLNYVNLVESLVAKYGPGTQLRRLVNSEQRTTLVWSKASLVVTLRNWGSDQGNATHFELIYKRRPNHADNL